MNPKEFLGECDFVFDCINPKCDSKPNRLKRNGIDLAAEAEIVVCARSAYGCGQQLNLIFVEPERTPDPDSVTAKQVEVLVRRNASYIEVQRTIRQLLGL